MRAIEFEGTNVVYAKDQPEYTPLPAFLNEKEGTATFCFELSKEEMKQVYNTGRIYLTVKTFNQPLQPILGSVLKPEL